MKVLKHIYVLSLAGLCGYNTGYHVYLEMGAVGTEPTSKAYIKFDLDTANWKSYNRRWNILASQIECDRDYHAPQVRLQTSQISFTFHHPKQKYRRGPVCPSIMQCSFYIQSNLSMVIFCYLMAGMSSIFLWKCWPGNCGGL